MGRQPICRLVLLLRQGVFLAFDGSSQTRFVIGRKAERLVKPATPEHGGRFQRFFQYDPARGHPHYAEIQFVSRGQRSRLLVPLPGTAEDRRLSFGRTHPAASMLLAGVAWIILATALVTQVPNLLNGIGHLTGWSVPTFGLPGWLDVFLGVAGILAGLDRGLRMKHNPLLDD